MPDINVISRAQSTPEDVVDWDGPNDPMNPMNWSLRKKVAATTTVSLLTVLTPLGSSMVAPAASQIMEEFHQPGNEELSAFVVSVYLLGYALGPLVLAPLSELHGRMIIYHVCNALYLICTVACALAPSLGSLIIFRLLAGTAGSAPLTIGAGSLADMIPAENRGLAMSAWVLGPVLGPVVGPVAGGYLAQAKGWRWTFWVLAMAAAVFTMITLGCLRESHPPTLLQRKTQKLRQETGNPSLRSARDAGRPAGSIFSSSILRPTRMLLFSPIVSLLALYIAVIYGYLYLLFTTISSVFKDIYHFSAGSVGLAYLGVGVGSIAGMVFQSLVSDRLFRRLKARHGIAKPEYRLPPLFLSCWFIPVSLFWYGWTANGAVHWISPIVATSLLGFGMLNAFTTVSTYLVDAYTGYAASAVAATTVLRSLGGAFLPLAGGPMYSTLGLGWGNSLLAFIALSLCPLPFLLYRFGERIREKTSVHL
ncbi:hypothetical protein EYZ11_004481 [Aspergillus tanneri]|uniref:Major facilitator superfamily (MFS) profile domain-containing protein n=1 Tax=Aspergillus tanneri TaxID=1220188 RepID=A0A4S3JL30_9EURO|nr:uncharacterized protein ATNIH1004_008245 [Aspergillus tanneri]KAA8644048.1 hypothetical protein ATNIH1004_008245 [Aspergillus tanneri]THC96060.1 hypothetical protein EYZ11_004481 [Aspergillus tanneri]